MAYPDQGPHVPCPAIMLQRRNLSEDTTLFRIGIETRNLDPFRTFTPGQFFQLSVPGAGEIPVSPADLPQDGTLEFCVRRVGQVTGLLHRKKPGARLGVRGPFGRGFPVAEMSGNHVLLLAGGLGIVPLRSLLRYLLKCRSDYRDVTLMYGARNLKAMLFREELTELAARHALRLFLTVDFAPEEPNGQVSCAVGLLPDLLRGFRFEAQKSYAVVCGPPALYRCLSEEIAGAGVARERILFSLERRMRCGVGRCCHCGIGQFLCCLDGPVFRLSELADLPEAL